jgi:hypothetical protein
MTYARGNGNWQRYLKETPKYLEAPRESIPGGCMKVNRDILVKLLEEAFDAGQNMSYSLKDQTVEEIVWTFQKGQENPWVVLPFAELCSLPSGRKIFHSTFGEGIVTIKNGERFVQFPGFRMELAEDGWPWTEKLQVIT